MTKRRTTQRPKRSYHSELSPEELETLAAPFEKEMTPDQPLTQAMRTQLKRAKRKRGRPIIGEGSTQVLLTIEQGLLRDADAHAKFHNQNRSQLFTQAVRSVIYRDQKKHRKSV